MLNKLNKKKSIGVFDSGLGGLSVLKYFLKELPDYSYIYLGDTAHLPYGDKSPEKIYQYTKKALDFLFQQGCPLVITACNSVSAQALRKIQQKYLPSKWPDRKVLGVVRPLAEAASNHKAGLIGIIGTRATISSQTYSKEIKNLNNQAIVLEKSAPLLVPLIEEGWAKKSVTNKILKHYLRPLKLAGVNYLILGCTHYPFLLPTIRRLMGKKCLVPNPGKIVALSLKDYLIRHPELNLSQRKKEQLKFFLSDISNQSLFENLGKKFLGQSLEKPILVEL